MKSHKRTVKKGTSAPIGIVHDNERIGLLCYDKSLLSKGLHIYWSIDGFHFGVERHPVLLYKGERLEKIELCHDFSFAKEGTRTVMTYVRDGAKGAHLVTAVSKNLHNFDVVSEMPHVKHKSVLVKDFTKDKDLFMYIGGLFIKVAHTKNLKEWKMEEELLFTSRSGDFDRAPIRLMGAHNTRKGILLTYDVSYKEGEKQVLQAGAILFAHGDPKKILWRAELPIFKNPMEDKHHRIKPLSAVLMGDQILLYWAYGDTVLQAEIPALFLANEEVKLSNLFLDRHHKNPIMAPHPHNAWESEAVFNPAAFFDGDEVHLIYRAIGSNGVSVFGYTASADGVSFRKRSPHPVYEPIPGFDIPEGGIKDEHLHTYNPQMYTSGGGWGGCEDPRAVKIGNRIYVTYVAFGGWNSIRMALTSISVKDFRNENWNWRKPVYLSPPNETHKNWVLFPEKINGKYAILHGIAPEILIDYVDDLDKLKKHIKSERPQGPQPGRKGFWDSKVRGAGPPPLKTDIGWLLFYHATDQYDPNKYKLGAMILDLNDPTKVLHRTSRPILSPEMNYENEGKPGVVYASGAIIKDEQLYVYYGGGDRVVCVATVPLKEFLSDIVNDVTIPFSLKDFKVS